MEKKRVFSGIQPTGEFTLGNYLGAVRHWGKMEEEYHCMFSIVDLHAITVKQNPAQLRKQILDGYAMLLACGLNPEKSILFVQSHVKLHTELGWILACNCQYGELGRMTQFKDKSKKYPEDINVGLFTYPVLMAADVLLYQSDLVPVGKDQKQHLELARDIGGRFNHNYSETFSIPEPMLPKLGGKIMSLGNPEKKMSKSDANQNGTIYLLDSPETIRKKVSKGVTDSEGKIYLSPTKGGINNLLTIYALCKEWTLEETEKFFQNKSYQELKEETAEAIIQELKPIQDKFYALRKNEEHLKEEMRKGAEKAEKIGKRTMDKVNKKVGLTPK